jgi:hypothetical protein
MPSDQLDLFEPPTIMLAPCGREPGPCPAVIESGQYRCQRCGHIAPVTVSERDGGFFAAGIRFPTHAAAWEWLDDHNTEDRAAVDRHHRIRDAFAGNGRAPSKNSCT